MFFTRHFMGRFLTKNLLMFFAITVPATIMPWPIKIVIDHVVLGTPIEEATGYPPVWRPFLTMPEGYTPLEVLLAVTIVVIILILLIGAYSQGDNGRDETTARRRNASATTPASPSSAIAASSGLGRPWGNSWRSATT